MSTYFPDNLASVGHTPLVRINRLVEGADATVLAKIEGRNPAFSVKDRIGVSMIRDAESRGVLRKGMEIVEPTSGNTGIALAYVCAIKGYKVTLTMPETMSIERRKVLKLFGAHLVLTDGTKGMKGAVAKAEEIISLDTAQYFMPQQFKNPSNPKMHELTTGPEIWDETDGKIDVFVSGVGTGGTLTGVARFIRHTKGKKIHVVAVEPAESPVISQTMQGKEPVPGPHKIQGIGAGFVPENLDLSLVDEVQLVTSDEALEFARRLAREEGLLSGISSGAAVLAAIRLAKRDEFRKKTIAVVLPSAGERYLSSALFEGIPG
ncbi:MAG TPA: cysteine synthase A [Desulfomonilaceae bacterium]|nr:cysteine synthase A [Desulfomonilaceae bacterium]